MFTFDLAAHNKSPVEIQEVASVYYPEKTGIFNPGRSILTPPENTNASFNGNQKLVCGPSPFINTLNCFSTKFLHFAKSVPIPGSVSATPVYTNDSWIIATTKGFLIRIKARSQNDSLPIIDPKTTEFWGSNSRQVMEDLVPKTVYKESTDEKTVPVENDDATRREECRVQNANQHTNKSQRNCDGIFDGYMWVFPTSSPFVGTPVVKNGIIYALTASQSLHAIDLNSGKLVWIVKISPDVSFSLENTSLLVTDTEVLIGTNRGRLLGLDPTTGAQIFATAIGNPDDQENRFPAIVAAPLILKNNEAVVSNAVSTTEKISLSSQKIIWTYAAGSITTPQHLNSSTIILTTVAGAIVSVNANTGAENWKVNPNMNSPFVSVTFANEKKTILVSTGRGELLALNSDTGKILAQTKPIGSVVGTFFQVSGQENESCLSFSIGSFRCFRVKL